MPTKKQLNKIAHETNGNIIKSLKISTWNKGNSHLINSINTLHQVVLENNPDIIGIQELNIRDTDNTDTLKIPGYHLITDNLINKNGLARAGILIKDSLNCQTRDDFTNKEDAHMAITVSITKKVKLNIHVWYRQWQELTNTGRIPGTKNIKKRESQLRLNLFTSPSRR